MPIPTVSQLRARILDGAKAYTDLALGSVTTTAITAPSDADVSAFVVGAVGDVMDILRLPRAAYGAVVDADLAAVPEAVIPRLLDESRKRTYELLLGRLRLFTQTSGNQKQQLVELITQLERMIASLAVEIRNRYGASNPGGAAAVAMTSAPALGAGGLSRYRAVPPSDREPWRFP